MIPTIGAKGMSGQAIMRMTPRTVLNIMRTRPIMMRKSLDTKPTHLDTRRSVKAWSFNSMEASLLALPAEICR